MYFLVMAVNAQTLRPIINTVSLVFDENELLKAEHYMNALNVNNTNDEIKYKIFPLRN